MNPMDYLKRAEDYCAARGDSDWFNRFYAGYRNFYNVTDSVFHSLSWIYDDDTALMLKYKYCETVL